MTNSILLDAVMFAAFSAAIVLFTPRAAILVARLVAVIALFITPYGLVRAWQFGARVARVARLESAIEFQSTRN